MLLSLLLSECWNEGFTGTERFVIILTIIVLIAAYGIKDEHKILKRVLGTIIVVVLAVGIFSYGGGGKEGLHVLGACLAWGGIGAFFLTGYVAILKVKATLYFML